jgi:DNA-binding NarL/FixJ family response regulator
MPTLVAMLLAVVDPLPMYRQGVVTVLSGAGHVVQEPDDPVAWAGQTGGRLLLLTLDAVAGWDLLPLLEHVAPRCLVIALVADASVASAVRAVRSGVRSVVAREAEAATLIRTVEATAAGQAVLPAQVMSALLAGVSPGMAGQNPLTAEQQRWLRQLADGMTVARISQQAGYSERAMFRLLQAVYARLGVRTRIEAVVHAQEQGWLLPEGGARFS